MTEKPADTIDLTEACVDSKDTAPALIAALAQQATTPWKLDEGIYGVLTSEGDVQIVETIGYEQQRIALWAAAHNAEPEFVDREVVLVDAESFTNYLARNTTGGANQTGTDVWEDYAWSSGQLELWADIDKQRITAILDGANGRRKHHATLQLQPSREWAEWSKIDGRMLSQVDFAQFVEDHLSTIAAPDAGVLLDICQTLQAHTSVHFKQQAILGNGQRQFKWEETVEAKAGQNGSLTIPGELVLVLRPFQGSIPVQVLARFRYQLRDGGLSIGVRLQEPDSVIETAFTAVIDEVQERVPVRVNNGRF